MNISLNEFFIIEKGRNAPSVLGFFAIRRGANLNVVEDTMPNQEKIYTNNVDENLYRYVFQAIAITDDDKVIIGKVVATDYGSHHILGETMFIRANECELMTVNKQFIEAIKHHKF
jgi:hypothetical protein